MAVTRTAQAIWEGDLPKGKGTVDAASSGSFETLPISWSARTEAPEGKTSPEELLAAAHASCYSMALSNTLAQAGSPAERLEISAAATFVPGEGVKSSELTVTGIVPGLDADRFEELAREGEANCPISNVIRGNADIKLTATLQQTAGAR